MIFRPFQGAEKHSRFFHARVRSPRGARVQISLGVVTERAAEIMEAKIERLRDQKIAGEPLDPAMLAWVNGLPERLARQLLKYGFLGEKECSSRRSVLELIEEWRRSIRVGGALEAHVQATCRPVREVAQACGWHSIADIDPGSVERYFERRIAEAHEEALARTAERAALRARAIAANAARPAGSLRRVPVPEGRVYAPRFNQATASRTGRYLIQFGSWLEERSLAPRSPFAGWARPEAGPEKSRQAFTAEQLRALLRTCREDPTVRMGMSGPERALLYHVAACTGCRANELREARAGWFVFEGSAGRLDVPKEFTKNRKGASVPIVDPSLVATLRRHLATKVPTAAAFAMPEKQAKMLREDLKRAGIAARAGDGLVFHSLRHAFVTMLAEAGVHPRTAQKLARHSSITLTMERYTHAERADVSAALARLPALALANSDDHSAGHSPPNAAG